MHRSSTTNGVFPNLWYADPRDLLILAFVVGPVSVALYNPRLPGSVQFAHFRRDTGKILRGCFWYVPDTQLGI